ncbi:MAG: IS4 family transposase [Muribaculaceae bacterium]|nr:IS4 family transposase [Muribaculaceae bacterium]
MYNVKYVFAQLIKFMNRNKFNRIVAKYDGDRYVKHFTCWNQLLVMMFGQLCNRSSLRDLITILEAHSNKCFHMGMGKNVFKTNLAYANQNRNCKIFEEFAYFMISEAREKCKTKIFDIGGNVYVFDSTTIDLCLAVFWWAKFRKKKGGIKVHTLYDVETQIPAFFHITTASVHDMKAMDLIPYEQGSYYIFDRGYNDFRRLFKIHTVEAFFVVRAKKNLKYKTLKWKRRMPKNVLSDSTVELTGFYSNQHYSGTLRMVRYRDDEQSREFTFLTNITHLSSLQIAELYRNRWKVELFFKWLKQHLKIKKLWGTSENAVRIQIYCAICAYCLVAIVQHDMHLDRSTYEVLQILGVSLTDTTHLVDLFDRTKSQNFNVLSDPNGPNLFNF